MPPNHVIDAALQEIYDQIPVISSCKGSCWLSCGPLDMSDRERTKIKAAGFKITPGQETKKRLDTYWCEALGPDGRCQVYQLRPTVCRLWGTVPSLACPRGCVPDGGFLAEADGWRLLVAAQQLGGCDVNYSTPEELERSLAHPEARAVLHGITTLSNDDQVRASAYGTELPPEVRSRRAKKQPGNHS